MKDLLELMKTRRSVRKYKPDMIPQDVLDRIIIAGTYSATGRNLQSPIIIAVTNKEMRDKISEMNRKIGGWAEGFDPFYGAPVILIVLADKSCPTYIYDGSLVMGNLMLAAHNEGVGSCWIHRAKEEFESEEGKEILRSLGIEGEYEGIGHCALGYTEGEYPEGHERKDNWYTISNNPDKLSNKKRSGQNRSVFFLLMSCHVRKFYADLLALICCGILERCANNCRLAIAVYFELALRKLLDIKLFCFPRIVVVIYLKDIFSVAIRILNKSDSVHCMSIVYSCNNRYAKAELVFKLFKALTVVVKVIL